MFNFIKMFKTFFMCFIIIIVILSVPMLSGCLKHTSCDEHFGTHYTHPLRDIDDLLSKFKINKKPHHKL